MKEEETDRKNTKKREKVKERKKVQDGLKKKAMTGTTPTPIVAKTATSPFMNDGDEEIDTAEIEEEAWFDYMKRSTAAAIER